MKVERGGNIGGQNAKVVRDMLREVGRRECFDLHDVVEYLQREWWRGYVDELIEQGKLRPDARTGWRRDWQRYSEQAGELVYGGRIRIEPIPDQTAAAKALIKQLLKDGSIERSPEKLGKQESFQCSMKGNAMRMTSFVPRIDRAKAEALLKGVLQRVAQNNKKPELLHWITEVRVFGSYLADTNDLGDLDVAIKLERLAVKPWAEACLSLAENSGKSFPNFLAELTYPEMELHRRIKNRSPYISLHYTSELDENPELGGKTIYTFAPPAQHANQK
jgi:hypothetical protein